jgi:DNA-binding beta-propeller fold protein YncE
MRKLTRESLVALCVALMALGAGAPAVQAAPGDPLFVFDPSKLPQQPPQPYPPFEGPCGLAVDVAGQLYVSDYYHHLVDVFTPADLPAFVPLLYVTQMKKVDPLDGPCGLGIGPTGAIYINNFHRNVENFMPSAFPQLYGVTFTAAGAIDSSHPTGVASDPVDGNVYVDDRTYVSAYDPSGEPLLDGGGEPLRIGLGSLGDGYGLAVSDFPPTAGRIYVPDATDDTIKVYDPMADPTTPVQVIDGAATPNGGFLSLHDSAIAVDAVSGEIYVADTGGPQYSERPKATIYVFDSTGTYEGRLKFDVVDGQPPGLAVDNSATATQGRVYVTSGNTENAVIYAYPPGAAISTPPPTFAVMGTTADPAAESAPASGFEPPAGSSRSAAAQRRSEIVQNGTLRLTAAGQISPRSLPRRGAAPIAVTVSGKITTTDGTPAPQLRKMRIELNGNGRLDYAGLPTCPYNRIQPASTSRALAACRDALVGKGSFTAEISLAGQEEPYPTQGRMLLFNGRQDGKQVLFGQIYSARPFANSFVIVFAIQKLGKGTYGTALTASLPDALGSWGNLTGIEMTLHRRFQAHGRSHSYISAGCPAPEGFSGATFPLARASFGFQGGKDLVSVLTDSCTAKG